MVAVAQRVTTEESSGAVESLSRFRAKQAFSEMDAWAHSPEALGLPEDAVERGLETRGREVWRLMLQSHLDARGTGYVGLRLEVKTAEGEVQERRAEREDRRGLTSIFGPVQMVRKAYTERGQETVHPLDEVLELPARSPSSELQRRLVEETVRGPFDEAVTAVERSTGNRLPKRLAEQVTLEASQDFVPFYAQRSAPPTEGTGPLLVVTTDCKGVPMVKPEGAVHRVRLKKGDKANKKKMATVATVDTRGSRVRTAEDVVASLFDDAPQKGAATAKPERKRVWASLERPQEEVFREVAAEVAARDPWSLKLRVFLTDGERRLRRMAVKFLPGFILVLDLMHVLEYLWKAAHALHAEGSAEADAWVRCHLLMILRGQVSEVIKGMRQSATKRGLRGARLKAVERAAAYFHTNRDRMHYDIYLALGLPIASGAAEGACRHLIKDRLERAGMRWQVPGAEAVLKLRAIHVSGDMDEYWTFHKRQEQLRLHGRFTWKAVS
jgi:hypothetical protein